MNCWPSWVAFLQTKASEFSEGKARDCLGNERTFQMAELKDQRKCARRTRSGSAAKWVRECVG